MRTMLNDRETHRLLADAPEAGRREAPVWGPSADSEHGDSPNLHQIAPGLCEAPFRIPRHLPGSSLPAQLPEQLADLHQPGGGDWIAHAHQSSRRAGGEFPATVKAAACQIVWSLASIGKLEALQVVQFFVGEGVIWLRHMDLSSRLSDPGHLVGHPRCLLHIAEVGRVAVSPVRGIQAPPHPLDPDRVISKAMD